MLALLRKDDVMVKALDRRSYFSPGIPWGSATGRAHKYVRYDAFPRYVGRHELRVRRQINLSALR